MKETFRQCQSLSLSRCGFCTLGGESLLIVIKIVLNTGYFVFDIAIPAIRDEKQKK
jgi:hypothetical protein